MNSEKTPWGSYLVAEARVKGALLEVFVYRDGNGEIENFMWKITPRHGSTAARRLGFPDRWKEKVGWQATFLGAMRRATMTFQKIVRNFRENK